MNANIYGPVLFMMMGMASVIQGQNVLTLDEVFNTLNKVNYDILLADQDMASALVLTSKYNRGYLPTLTARSSATYKLGGLSQLFYGSTDATGYQNASSVLADASLSADYLLFDSGNRKLVNEKNMEVLNSSNLTKELTTQNVRYTAGQLYFQIARTMRGRNILTESYAVSQRRLDRTEAYYRYGQSSKADVLSAEVDVKRDSLSIVKLAVAITNLKVRMNGLLDRDSDSAFEVDTFIVLKYMNTSKDELLNQMHNQNKELAISHQNKKLANFDSKLASKLNTPQVHLSSGYNFNFVKNDDNYLLDYSTANGFNAGISANWTILDGGFKEVQQQRATILMHKSDLQLKKLQRNLTAEFDQVWNNYQTNLLILKLEKENIKINEVNFKRVEERYKNGQLGSIDFRQAQLNLLNAQLQYNNALHDAKLNELEIDFYLGNL